MPRFTRQTASNSALLAHTATASRGLLGQASSALQPRHRPHASRRGTAVTPRTTSHTSPSRELALLQSTGDPAARDGRTDEASRRSARGLRARPAQQRKRSQRAFAGTTSSKQLQGMGRGSSQVVATVLPWRGARQLHLILNSCCMRLDPLTFTAVVRPACWTPEQRRLADRC